MLDWYAFVSYPRFRIHHFTAEDELRGFVAIRKEFFPGWKVSVQRFTDDLGLHSPGDDDRDTGRRGYTDLGDESALSRSQTITQGVTRMSDISSATAADFRSALEEFETAWKNPNHTRFILPAIEVNSVLAKKYITTAPVKLTRDMIWDMERQKAWDPATFIPYVVSQGKSWGRSKLSDGSEHFFRSSEQLGWIVEGRGTVLEEVFVDDAGQRILFLGRESTPSDSGVLRASGFQPLFHVEHGVGGSIEEPLNLWRIVILTEEYDDRYTQPFKEMVRQGLLPGFLEIYIERRFRCELKRKSS
jgi:hypothetical protein